MEQLLPEGIPLTHEYKAILKSDLFQSMEQYSNQFLAENRAALHKANSCTSEVPKQAICQAKSRL